MSAFGNYPMYQNPYQQALQQYQQAMAQTMTQLPQSAPQMQNNGFVHVQSEAQAKEYPVAPGGSMTFINDNEPYCYTKSMGLSQLEPPIFKRFRLVEEADIPQNVQNATETPLRSQGIDLSSYALKSDLEATKALYEDLNARVEMLTKKSSPKAKKEAAEDE